MSVRTGRSRRRPGYETAAWGGARVRVKARAID